MSAKFPRGGGGGGQDFFSPKSIPCFTGYLNVVKENINHIVLLFIGYL